jgi:hypothetical protein
MTHLKASSVALVLLLILDHLDCTPVTLAAGGDKGIEAGSNTSGMLNVQLSIPSNDEIPH